MALYSSTRGLNEAYSFEQSLIKGFAEDGGLITPSKIPKIASDVIKSWRHHSYVDVVFEIAKIYIDPSEIDHQQLRDVLYAAYSSFEVQEIVKFAKLKSGLVVAELFHGPTRAFKDLSMTVVAQLLNHFLKKRSKHAIALVATSGDTGGSAVASMAALSNVHLVVIFPQHGCTEMQRLHMVTASQPNIHCFAVEGSCDDGDVVTNKVLCDVPFASQHNVTVANSTNWARILVQTATFFYVYLRNVERMGDEMTIVIPSGGGGNLTAACLAHLMSLPIKIVATVNTNDVIHRFLKQGVLSTAGHVSNTWASAMDIQIPANLERILYLFSEDQQLTKALMEEFYSNRLVQIPQHIISKIGRVIVDSYSVSDSEIIETVKRCWEENGYAVCPHTSTAIAYARQRQLHTNAVSIATASPVKFPEAMEAAQIHLPNDDLQRLRLLPTRFRTMGKGDDWEDVLRSHIRNIHKAMLK